MSSANDDYHPMDDRPSHVDDRPSHVDDRPSHVDDRPSRADDRPSQSNNSRGNPVADQGGSDYVPPVRPNFAEPQDTRGGMLDQDAGAGGYDEGYDDEEARPRYDPPPRSPRRWYRRQPSNSNVCRLVLIGLVFLGCVALVVLVANWNKFNGSSSGSSTVNTDSNTGGAGGDSSSDNSGDDSGDGGDDSGDGGDGGDEGEQSSTATPEPLSSTAGVTPYEWPTAPGTGVCFILYSNSAWTTGTINIHYNGGGGWTSVPGEAMAAVPDAALTGDFADYKGYFYKAIKATSLEFVFNKDGSEWDSNSDANYKVTKAGTYAIKDSKITTIKEY